MGQQFTDEQIDDMIACVNEEAEAYRGLTAWERQFMTSITDQWERRRRLSPGQLECLERIYAEKTP